MNKNLIKILAIAVILLPLFVFAQNQYPNAPFTQTTITQNSQLGDVVKYVATWAIIIGGIIVFGSLIAAGIQYISSTGDPSKMKEARDRIIGSFIGTLILLGSYLILATINPQLTILKVNNPTPITNQPALTTPTGRTNLQGRNLPPQGESMWAKTNRKIGGVLQKMGLKKKTLNPIKNIGLIQTVFAQTCLIVDSEVISQNEVNFKDFTFDSIFIPRDNNGNLPEIKIIVYSKENFQGEAKQIYPSNTINYESVSGEGWSGVLIKKEDVFFISDLKGEEVLDENDNKISESGLACNFYHPPLSIKVLGTGPGIYLYNSSDSKTGDERYLDGSFDNLTSSDIDFDNQTTKIGVRNDASDDYLAILFEEPNYEGQFRMFFENKDTKKRKFPNADNSDYIDIQTGNVTLRPGGESFAEIRKGGDKNGDVILDKFGQVKDASSIIIAQINKDPSVCEEIRLCTGPEYFGNCVVYLPAGKKIDWNLETEGVGLIEQPMPLYVPKNILQGKFDVDFKKKDDNGSTSMEKRSVEFNDNIYSIKIKGNCLVALFENRPTTTGFENSGPGMNSEVFTDSVFDLNPYNITNCRPWSGLGFWQTQSCASSIAVFPTPNSGSASRSF